MLNNITNEATEETKNQSATTQPSMSLGGGGAQIQEVSNTSNGKDNAYWERYTEDKQKQYDALQNKQADQPKEKTQGDYENIIYNGTANIEKWNEEINKIKGMDFNQLLKYSNDMKEIDPTLAEELKKLTSNSKDPATNIKDRLNQLYNNRITNTRNEIYDARTNNDYDARTDGEMREDTGAQRTTEDYRLAGLNPKAISGATFTGGGGGNSSRGEEEEEKRKRRRKEIEENRRAKEAEKIRERELITGVITNLMGTTGKTVGYGMIANNKKSNANQTQKKNPNWTKAYLADLENEEEL